jgi:hypothetical protein
MNELSIQDKGVGATTILIDRRISCFANRSHGQRIVVKKNTLVKIRTTWILASEKMIKTLWNLLKLGKLNLALIATHAKLGIIVRGLRKGFSSPTKGMARRAFNVHPSKTMNLSSRIKGLVSNRNNKRLWW